MKTILFIMTLILTGSFRVEAETSGANVPMKKPEKAEFLGQQQSNISWGNLPTESFLSFREWKEESDIKDQVPDWEKIIRERNHREMVGRIYQCVGRCRIDRGESFFNGSSRTGIYEGDEIQTIGDSFAWIFLFDGTMVRLSPQSSITFNEFNVGVEENFVNARVNAGDIVWLSRQETKYDEINIRETDVSFLPAAEYEANPVTDVKPYIEDDLIELVSEKNTNINHFKALNEAIEKNNKLTRNKKTYAFIVMPNATLMGHSPNLEIITLIGGKTYFKSRSNTTQGLNKDDEPKDLFLQMRGFDNKSLNAIQTDLWVTVDEKGRNYSQTENTHLFDIGEFITKRIPSIMMGREIFLARYSEFAFREKYDPLVLAKKDGYRLWGKMTSKEGEAKADLELRLDFLKEYFRRAETSNLLTSSRFTERLQARGEKGQTTEYGDYFFITALNRYYRAGEKNQDNSGDKETGEVLNSTKKLLWKKMNGIR